MKVYLIHFALIRVNARKCIFRSFDLFQFPFDNKKPLLDVLCPCPSEGLSASRLARPKRTLARLIVKSFLGIKLTTNTNHQFHDFFAHFCCRHANRYHVGWTETLYTVQNLHCDNDS